MKPQIRSGATSFFVAVFAVFFALVSVFPTGVFAASGINKQINLQGKLVNPTTGINVADGTYNMEFKIYQDGDGVPGGGDETLKWTETRTSGNKVTVTDGVFRVSLGSVTAFGSSVDWNQDTLWVSINIGGTGTPGWDGEMNPMVRLSATPYALNAEKVNGLTVTATTGTLTLANTKTFTVNNTITLAGTDSTSFTLPSTSGGTIITSNATSQSISTALTLSATGGNALALSGAPASAGTSSLLQLGPNAIAVGSANGNYIGINPASFSGNFFEFEVNGENKAKLDSAGKLWVTSCDGCGGGGGTLQQAYDTGNTITTDATGDITITLAELGTPTTFEIFNNDTAGVSALEVDNTIASGTLTNGLFIEQSAAGTMTNAIQIAETAGTITDGILITGTLGNILNSPTIDITGAGAITGATGISITTGSSYTGAGAVTLSSGGSSGLTLDSASGRVSIATGDFLSAIVSGVTGATAGDIWYDSAAGKFKINEASGGTKILCNTTDAGCGAGGSADLQTTYGNDADGSNATISLTSADDSVVISNPASSGTDSTFVLKTEQLNTGAAIDALYVDNRGTGNSFRVDDTSSDTTPFIVDSDGRVGVGTTSVTGSTERLLQVGSSTNRGNIVAYGDVVTEGVSDITTLTNIKDIFVYDTTADSDGGKWIDWATTDQLSWYTESLDDGPNDPCNIASDDRCYAQAFPRRAILVVTLDDLYIFDAATNDMWMKFSQNAAGWALGATTNNDISSVTAVNGVIYVTTNGTANSGLYVIDFVNDRMWNIDGTDRSGADVGISGRNAVVTYNSDNNTAFDLSVTGTASEWEDLNDVSAVYITGSSTAIAIGAATNTSPGSGQTFVGLATDSGVTIINMTAQKLLQYSDAASNDYTAVALTRRGRMYALNTTLDQLEKWHNFDTDKASEIAGTPDKAYDETVGPALWNSTPNLIAGAPDALEVVERGSLADDTSDIIYVGHSLGLTEIHDHATVTNGWSKFFDTTRQTMLMPAAIKMALMMDDTSGTLANDISYNNTDMTILGSPTLAVSGVRGKAMNFDNTNDYLCSDADQNGTCDVDTAFNMTTTGWTLSLWFKHSTTAPASGVDMLFEKCVTATPAQATGCVAAYMTSTGTIVVANDDDATWTQGSSYDVTGTSTLTYNDNQWHQLTFSRTNANDVDTYIDGNPLNLSTATGLTITFDGSQIVTIGASCSTTTGANCAAANALNFWDGQIDDVIYTNGTTTISQFSALQARRFYNDARPLVAKRVVTVTDTTTVSSTTIGDSGESWIPNEFAGLFVTLTGGTGSGQTRRITSNNTTTLTVSPAFQTTPDTTTDFEVDPEALYGASNSVYAIGITGENPLGQSRQMCIGTNDGSDGGGVTCYNHQAGPNLIADLFHGDSEQTDDFGAEWTGTDYDDIRSIDFSGRTLVIGSEAHIYAETGDVRLGQALDYMANQLFNIRGEIINDGITLTGSSAIEVGFTGGADLAEYYTSDETLEKGEVIAMDPNIVAGVKRSTKAYQGDVLGIVATSPGITLGESSELSYPVALVGRVPVKVSTESGMIKAGDYITASSVPGYGMKAIKAGRVLGKALEDLKEENLTDCTVEEEVVVDKKCGTITVFVNLTNSLGLPIQLAASDSAGLGLVSYLDELKKQASDSGILSEIFTDRVSATESIISPKIITDLLETESLKIKGETIFEKLVTLLANVIFRGEVSFEKVPIFSQDTAGFAKIKKGERYVDVSFDAEYAYEPIVNVALDIPSMTQDVYEQKVVAGDCILPSTKEECEQKLTQEFLGDKVNFVITRRSNKGFLILLEEPAKADITFSWIALAVKDAKTSTKTSVDDLFKTNAQEQSQLTPVISPTPSLAPTVVAPTEITPSPSAIPTPQQ